MAVMARGAVAPLGPPSLRPAALDRPVRFLGARVETAHGVVAIGAVHLKCCGHAGSDEDTARMIEAVSVNSALREALGVAPADAVVLGGDLNLVGAPSPLDALRAGLDADGSDLEVAEIFTLGDDTQATWSAPGSIFTPGRLDYLCYSGASSEVVQSFVLDTSRLGPVALRGAGLLAGDGEASDHRPVVIDVRLR
jgi:endonuclease/exonuclease/phosphatase family metal-dependent hydrolase